MGRAFGVVLVACLFAAAPGRAQVPAPPPAAPPVTQPVTGFVSSYEITRIARSAGFDPLAPPLREGTIYVLRATDYRGILMRVVIDARTGAIRDANRIVPARGATASSIAHRRSTIRQTLRSRSWCRARPRWSRR